MIDHRPSFISGLIVLTCIIIVCAGLKLSAEILSPVLFSLTITFLVWPIIQWLQNKGFSHTISLILVTSVVVLSITVLMVTLLNSLNLLTQKFPVYISLLNEKTSLLVTYLEKEHIEMSIFQNSEFSGGTMVETTINFMSNFISNVLSLSMSLFILLLMIFSSDSFVRRIQKYNVGNGSFMKNFVSWTGHIRQQFLVQTLSNFISGIVTTIIFILLGIDLAPLWGILVFFLAYIPNIGITIASIPPIILAFILHGWQTALLTIASVILLNLIMDNIFTPKFMGVTLKLPTVIVFLSFMFWTWIFGPLGAFISLPLTQALRSLLASSPQTAKIAEIFTSE